MQGIESSKLSKGQQNSNGKKSSIKKLFGSTSVTSLMYVPAMLLFAIIVVYPFLRGIQLSFTNWNGYSQVYSYIGLDNYVRMLTDSNILVVIKNTIIYGVGSTLFQNVIGLLLALFLNQQFRTRGFTRTIVYLPVIISPLIMGYIWYFFFELHGGALNDIFILFGSEPKNLLGNMTLNVWIITFVNTFQFVGISMVIYLAGLQVIPKDYYEAAEIDGASNWAKFKGVTWPLLAPAVTISVILNLIGGLKLFDVIVAMTDGGPGYASSSLSTFMYQLFFARQDAGYATAVGNLMFLLIVIISITLLSYLRKKEESL